MGFIPIVNRQNAGFQLVTSTNAMHDCPDAVAALREIRRVIAPSGNLIITNRCKEYIGHYNIGKVLMVRDLSA